MPKSFYKLPKTSREKNTAPSHPLLNHKCTCWTANAPGDQPDGTGDLQLPGVGPERGAGGLAKFETGVTQRLWNWRIEDWSCPLDCHPYHRSHPLANSSFIVIGPTRQRQADSLVGPNNLPQHRVEPNRNPEWTPGSPSHSDPLSPTSSEPTTPPTPKCCQMSLLGLAAARLQSIYHV